jgi:hypothetical protein
MTSVGRGTNRLSSWVEKLQQFQVCSQDAVSVPLVQTFSGLLGQIRTLPGGCVEEKEIGLLLLFVPMPVGPLLAAWGVKKF